MVFGRLIARRPKSRGMRSQGSAMISDPGGSAFGSVASEPISPIKLCIEGKYLLLLIHFPKKIISITKLMM